MHNKDAYSERSQILSYHWQNVVKHAFILQWVNQNIHERPNINSTIGQTVSKFLHVRHQPIKSIRFTFNRASPLSRTDEDFSQILT
jgi:hypothetical protein